MTIKTRRSIRDACGEGVGCSTDFERFPHRFEILHLDLD